MGFPSDFIWGAASSAYQIEGAASADGRGASIWDVMCQRQDAVFGGHTGETACDHYRRYHDDVALMSELRLQAYRFSVSWPRVLPEGAGEINERGLDFYDRLVDALVQADITPYVTLFHWDFPEALYQRGGWLSRESAAWFADFAAVVVARLGDRVKQWITINEPQVVMQVGHRDGRHAPGDRLSMRRALTASHNMLRAHGKAVQAIRSAAGGGCRIGYAPAGVVAIPATESEHDIAAARRATLQVSPDHLYSNTWWLDPVVFGSYPQDGLNVYGEATPLVEPGDMEEICQPLDFLGLNIYFGDFVTMSADGGSERLSRKVDQPLTRMGTPVTPESLYWGPRLIGERYQLPMIITENGMSNTEWVSLDGQVHDPQRIDFMRRYLRELKRGVEEGVDVRGYFYWSILDNFEWAEGFRQRFGLVYVDYESQARIPKDSARWYSAVIASNGEAIDR